MSVKVGNECNQSCDMLSCKERDQKGPGVSEWLTMSPVIDILKVQVLQSGRWMNQFQGHLCRPESVVITLSCY